jgi:hypothetical protein
VRCFRGFAGPLPRARCRIRPGVVATTNFPIWDTSGRRFGRHPQVGTWRLCSAAPVWVGADVQMAGLQRQMQMGDMTAYKPISPRLDISITASIHGINYTAPISTTPARHAWPTSLVCAGSSRNRRNRDASSHRLSVSSWGFSEPLLSRHLLACHPRRTNQPRIAAPTSLPQFTQRGTPTSTRKKYSESRP